MNVPLVPLLEKAPSLEGAAAKALGYFRLERVEQHDFLMTEYSLLHSRSKEINPGV